MKIFDVYEKIKNRKGQFINVEWESEIPLLKTTTCTSTIVKKVRMVGRVGIDYNKRKSVIEKRKNTINTNSNFKSSMEWELFPFIKRSKKSNNYYLTLTPSSKNKTVVEFYMDNKKIDRTELDGIVSASKWKKSKRTDTDVINVPIDDIIKLGK